MNFITVTRPDGSSIAFNAVNIFSIQTHQDVRETVAEILALIAKTSA